MLFHLYGIDETHFCQSDVTIICIPGACLSSDQDALETEKDNYLSVT